MRHHPVCLLCLAVVTGSCVLIKSTRQLCCFRECPGKILVSALLIPLVLLLLVADPNGRNLSTVRYKIPNIDKSPTLTNRSIGPVSSISAGPRILPMPGFVRSLLYGSRRSTHSPTTDSSDLICKVKKSMLSLIAFPASARSSLPAK
jgi:hypothetical protein